MFLTKLSLRKLRNIKEAHLDLNRKTNVIVGENAAGKTTVLEGIDILSRGRSFRTNKIENLANQGKGGFYVGATIGKAEKKIEIEKEKNKTKILINGKEEKKQSVIAKELAVQSIHPNSHSLVEGPPSERRSFCDWGLFHVEQDFKKLWSSYIKILKQRNEALKTKDSSENMWVEKLASAGEEISTMREKYVSRLQTKLNETGNYIMPNQELNFVYERGWNEKMSLIESLKEKAQLDSDRGFTSVGPQNANIKIMLNGHEAQKVCSRGQQKLIANIMLLSQSKDFYEKRNFPNIILVDDLSAELTLEMQEKILERLFESKSQVFLTALNDSVLADILYEMDTNVFHVEHGEIA